MGLAATCGPAGDEDCCASLPVPAGTYFRSYDGLYNMDKSYPATVDGFYLDKYEITVGRFRRFVEAGQGTQASPPAAGAGVHPLIHNSGWSSAWNSNLVADTAALTAALKCQSPFQTWTDSPSWNEGRPQNCLNWYDAFAFCAWDGGRLATEAEWNYAAAGGSEQRVYPWSDPRTSETVSYDQASYDCMGDGVSGCTLADLVVVGSKPAGNGRWRHADLAGNVYEWILDWSSTPPPLPCNNCANLTSASERGLRGGDFISGIGTNLRSSARMISEPLLRDGNKGSRCARTSF